MTSEKTPVPPVNTTAETAQPSAIPVAEPLAPPAPYPSQEPTLTSSQHPAQQEKQNKMKRELDHLKAKLNAQSASSKISTGLLLVLAWILPPFAVICKLGASGHVCLNIVLLFFGWFPAGELD